MLLGAGVLWVAGCQGDAAAGGADTDPSEETFSRVINVEVSEVTRAPFTERIRLSGTVAANRDVTLAAEEAGVIREIVVEKGTGVRQGQPLIRIDDSILRAQAAQARARAALAQELWERRKRLWEEDRVGSEQAYLEARFNAEEARANLEMLEERLSRTVIRAPVEGILEEQLVEVGSMVSPGTPVARIVDLDPVKITGGVPERYADDVSVGTPARVLLQVLQGEASEGELTFVGSTVNPRNRTFPVEFELPNPDRLVKPEMVAQVSLVRRHLDQAVSVPQEALVRVEDGFVAFVVVEEEGRTVARARPVVLGPSQQNRVVIQEGLETGELLVVVGQQQLAHGDRVRVVEEREAPTPEVEPAEVGEEEEPVPGAPDLSGGSGGGR